MTLPRNLNQIVPTDSFIGQYMNTCDMLETAREYDFWGAVWALGAACGRGVVVPRPFAPVYLNWYVLFVAESGITRKSTAVKLARDTVRKSSSIRMIEQRVSPAKMLNDMASDTFNKGHGQAHIAVSELVTFLGRDRAMIDLPAFLTDMYDCPDERVGGGSAHAEFTTIKNVFVTFLSASTPTWLRNAVNPDVVEGGFTSRCLFIAADTPKHKIAWPSAQGLRTEELQHTLHTCVEKACETEHIELMDAAMTRYEQWYKSRIPSFEPFLASFAAREDAHVLRLAACLAINAGTYAITLGQMNFAIRAIAGVKADASRIFEAGADPHGIALAAARTIELVCEAGPAGISRTELTKRIRHLAKLDELTVLLDTMHELHMLRKFEAKAARGRPSVVYARGKNIRMRRAVQDLHDTLMI